MHPVCSFFLHLRLILHSAWNHCFKVVGRVALCRGKFWWAWKNVWCHTHHMETFQVCRCCIYDVINWELIGWQVRTQLKHSQCAMFDRWRITARHERGVVWGRYTSRLTLSLDIYDRRVWHQTFTHAYQSFPTTKSCSVFLNHTAFYSYTYTFILVFPARAAIMDAIESATVKSEELGKKKIHHSK